LGFTYPSKKQADNEESKEEGVKRESVTTRYFRMSVVTAFIIENEHLWISPVFRYERIFGVAFSKFLEQS
jgi:hypothetical protein